MMPATTGGMFGLVEMVDVDDLLDGYELDSFSTLHGVYIERLKNWIRSGDQWKLLGNNRVCVLLKGMTSRAELELATSKLARVFEEPHYLLGRPFPLEVTAGFTAVHVSDLENETAVREAAMALRRAKASSRLFEVYGPQLENSAIDERGLVSRLETALERGDLQLYFQPKIHAGYRSLVGAEALMRWHTADGKVITPDEFMEVAERHAVIRPMTWWAIKSAIARLARWPEDLSIAVNIPPTLLLDDEILTIVKDTLDIHGVKPRRLNLEVTESVMVDNQEKMLAQLARLRKQGVKVSLDDFGTGFSSLAYFRDLPADEIKIDKGFVIPMLESGKDHAIVKAVIGLAHNFSLRVVAEGVENERIAKRLAELRCDIFQGYAFDPPLPIAEFEKRYLV